MLARVVARLVHRLIGRRPVALKPARTAATAWGLVSCALAPTLAFSAEPAPERSPLAPGSIRWSEERAWGRLKDGTAAELTLDAELQRAAAKLLKGANPVAGAAIALRVSTGEVLAYEQFIRAGSPAYDVLTSEAPSASVFKLVTTAALFDRTTVQLQTPVCWDGGEREILRIHLDPPARGVGRCAPFATALGFSRNAVYAQLATEHLMRDDLNQVASKLGFNAPLAFDATAHVGSVQLPYNDLEFARAAAGFTGSSLSPLGAAHLAYTVALGGQAARMRLVRRAGDFVAPAGREPLGAVMSANTAWRLTRMMEVTVHSGTSLQAFSEPDGSSYLADIRVAGKTGTLRDPETARTTMWFTGFAPSRNPEIVVTVLLHNDKIWRHKANEVARDLLRVFFKNHKGVSDPLEVAHK